MTEDARRTHQTSASIPDRLAAALAAVVASTGARLYDVELTGAGGARVVRVTVERDGGIDLEALGPLTHAISAALDAEPAAGLVGEGYALEVSSPGLERPLRRPEHFAGAVGSVVSVKHRDDHGVAVRQRGVLTAADHDALSVVVEGETVRIRHEAVLSARTVFEWGPAPKPGQGDASRRAPSPGRATASTKEVASR